MHADLATSLENTMETLQTAEMCAVAAEEAHRVGVLALWSAGEKLRRAADLLRARAKLQALRSFLRSFTQTPQLQPLGAPRREAQLRALGSPPWCLLWCLFGLLLPSHLDLLCSTCNQRKFVRQGMSTGSLFGSEGRMCRASNFLYTRKHASGHMQNIGL